MRVYQSPRGVRSLFAFINLILRHFQAHRAGPDPSRAHRRDKNSSVKYREGELHSRLRGRSLKKKKNLPHDAADMLDENTTGKERRSPRTGGKSVVS